MRKDISDLKRLSLICIASVIMAINIKTFVRAGGLFPGGFNSLTIFIQDIFSQFFNKNIPFTAINFPLNAVLVVISFKMLGKKFTLYSCVYIVLTGILADLIPAQPLTYDILLISVFGGIINGFAISICLLSEASGGGTDFIAILMSEKFKVDAWNYILLGNAIMLVIAGYLFGWDKALYSIIFQYTSTQIVKLLHLKYKKHTLFIITDYPEEIYMLISEMTHHDATIFQGIGCFQKKTHSMIYSVVSSAEKKKVVSKIREKDPKAFINVIKTDQLDGRFYQKPND